MSFSPSLGGLKFLLPSLFFMGVSLFDPVGPSEKCNILLGKIRLNTHNASTEVQDIANEIEALEQNLIEEMEHMKELRLKQQLLCTDFWWFLDPATQLTVFEAQIDINQQERKITGVKDRQELQWRKLKPLFGVRSSLFAVDAGLSLLSVLTFMANVLCPVPLTFSLAALIVFGPIVLLGLSFIFMLGWMLLPSFTLLLGMFWAIHMPMMISEYAPTKGQFIGLYVGGLCCLISILSAVLWLLRPSQGYGGSLRELSVSRTRFFPPLVSDYNPILPGLGPESPQLIAPQRRRSRRVIPVVEDEEGESQFKSGNGIVESKGLEAEGDVNKAKDKHE